MVRSNETTRYALMKVKLQEIVPHGGLPELVANLGELLLKLLDHLQ